MSAYFESGFCVRQPSWHGQENLLTDHPEDWDAARLAAGLMWEPTYRELYTPRRIPAAAELPTGAVVTATDPDGTRTAMVPIDGHRAIVRDDTDAVLATCKDSYELIYHHQMGDLLDAYSAAWRKAGAKVKFETAGSLKGGRLVWALVYLDEPMTVPGDDSATLPFAALLNAHDGSAACRLMATSVRVVCWNTWKMAEVDAARHGQQVVLRHTGNITERLETARAGLAAMRDEAKAWHELATDLAGVRYTDPMVRTFLDEFIPPAPEGASERTRNDRAAKRAVFNAMWNESPTVAPLPDTAYKMVQAAGEYLDHLRPYRSSETYLTRTMLTPEDKKGRVVRLARRVAADLAS